MKGRGLLFKKSIGPYLYLLPSISIFLVFLILPIFSIFGISFTKYNYFKSPEFVGIDQYKRLIGDPLFWKSLRNTFLYVLMCVPFLTFFPLLIAMLLNVGIRAKSFFRALFFIPVVSSAIVVSLIWKWMYYGGKEGVINYLLHFVGIEPKVWLGFPEYALTAIAIMANWKSVGYYMIFYLAGLQTIPRQLVEAAKIDGASGWHIFYSITLPLLRPIIMLVIILVSIYSFQVFDFIYVLTRGGPAWSTITVNWLIYSRAFTSYQMGYASSIGVILFIIIFIVSMLQVRFLGRKFEY